MENLRYIVIDHDAGCINKTNEITEEIESMVHQGYYEIIDLETMETINSDKTGLVRRSITEY